MFWQQSQAAGVLIILLLVYWKKMNTSTMTSLLLSNVCFKLREWEAPALECYNNCIETIQNKKQTNKTKPKTNRLICWAKKEGAGNGDQERSLTYFWSCYKKMLKKDLLEIFGNTELRSRCIIVSQWEKKHKTSTLVIPEASEGPAFVPVVKEPVFSNELSLWGHVQSIRSFNSFPTAAPSSPKAHSCGPALSLLAAPNLCSSSSITSQLIAPLEAQTRRELLS